MINNFNMEEVNGVGGVISHQPRDTRLTSFSTPSESSLESIYHTNRLSLSSMLLSNIDDCLTKEELAELNLSIGIKKWK